jgi:hypothetical protein
MLDLGTVKSLFVSFCFGVYCACVGGGDGLV